MIGITWDEVKGFMCAAKAVVEFLAAVITIGVGINLPGWIAKSRIPWHQIEGYQERRSERIEAQLYGRSLFTKLRAWFVRCSQDWWHHRR